MAFRNGKPIIIAALCAIALSGCGRGSASADERSGADISKPGAENAGAFADMSLGDPNASVTVIEYASVTCPGCASFHENIFPQIKHDYIDTGKVRFVFREFPTAPAELSIAGSMLARCAADSHGTDAYFLIVDSLFRTQRTWIFGGNARAELIRIASQAGMDEAAFDACVRREELIEFINKNINVAKEKYSIRTTPSFIIDDQLRQFRNAEEFTAALDEALAKADG